jgi:prefoldin subunit 5
MSVVIDADQLKERIEQLRHELDKGQAQMERLDRQRRQLRNTILRISGALQVLEELLGAASTHTVTTSCFAVSPPRDDHPET